MAQLIPETGVKELASTLEYAVTEKQHPSQALLLQTGSTYQEHFFLSLVFLFLLSHFFLILTIQLSGHLSHDFSIGFL